MHCYRLGLQMNLLVVSPRDDLTTCSSFVEINPEKPSLLCASSLMDSSVNEVHGIKPRIVLELTNTTEITLKSIEIPRIFLKDEGPPLT
jgi:hypothetical protein